MCKIIEETKQEDGAYEATNSFASGFSDNRSVLHFIAWRVLGCHKEAQTAVQECLKKALRNPPVFQSDGEFRSWLVRRAIDEALLILSQKRYGL